MRTARRITTVAAEITCPYCGEAIPNSYRGSFHWCAEDFRTVALPEYGERDHIITTCECGERVRIRIPKWAT